MSQTRGGLEHRLHSAILEDPLAEPGAVAVEQVEGASVIALRGEHDLSTGPAIEAACDDAWAHSGQIINAGQTLTRDEALRTISAPG